MQNTLGGSEQLLCEIYRCTKKEGMYVYVARGTVETIPEALKQRTGHLELAMTLLITPEKKLARAQAQDVLTAIDNQGFYLQMPPAAGAEEDAIHQAINRANDLLER